jgi:DNA-directed RNA polymerase subunit omega
MARITVEDCLVHEPNRFALVRLAALRAKALLAGRAAVTDTRGNKSIVSALREIADGKIRFRRRSALEERESVAGLNLLSSREADNSN